MTMNEERGRKKKKAVEGQSQPSRAFIGFAGNCKFPQRANDMQAAIKKMSSVSIKKEGPRILGVDWWMSGLF